MSHRRTSITALAVAVGLLTAACTAPADITDATAASPDIPADATATPARPASQQGALDEFTARINGTSADQTLQQLQEGTDADHRWREEFIAACMAEQGFTYYPRLQIPLTVTVSDGPAQGTREFAERYGFGFATNNVRGGGYIGTTAEIDTETEPNQSLIEAMSDAEWEAWSYAMWGEVSEWRSLMFGNFGLGSSCNRKAWETFIPMEMPEFRALSTEISIFNHAIQTNPQMLALAREWTECLAEQGHPIRLRDPIQLWESLNREWRGVEDLDPTMRFMAAWDWDTYPDGPPDWDWGPGGWDRLRDAMPRLEPDAWAAYIAAQAEFETREMALALADVDCRESLDFDARALVINHQLQQEFVDRNRDELEAWAAAAEAARDNR